MLRNTLLASMLIAASPFACASISPKECGQIALDEKRLFKPQKDIDDQFYEANLIIACSIGYQSGLDKKSLNDALHNVIDWFTTNRLFPLSMNSAFLSAGLQGYFIAKYQEVTEKEL